MNINDKLTMKTESGNIVELTVTDYKKAKPEYPIENGDVYWCITANGGVNEYAWCENRDDIAKYELGNTYNTEEECDHATEVQKARVRLQRKANFEPDWGDMKQRKYYVEYDHFHNCLTICGTRWIQAIDCIYFTSEEAAKQSIEEDEADWNLVLGVE